MEGGGGSLRFATQRSVRGSLSFTNCLIYDKYIDFSIFRWLWKLKFVSKPRMGKRKRNTKHVINCGQHKEAETCAQCLVIKPLDRLPFTKLPRNGEVLARLLALNAENNKIDNVGNLAKTVSYLWILSNVYTKGEKYICNDINHIYDMYRKLKRYTHAKKGPTFLKQLKEFKEFLDQLFDIKCNDSKRNTRQAQYWGVKMEEEDLQFYKNQKSTPPIGSCTSTIDKHALAKSERAQKRRKYENKQRNERDQYQKDLEGCTLDSDIESIIDMEIEVEHNSDDKSYVPEPDDEKYKYTTLPEDESDEMPLKYRHIRHGMRSVRPEIYEAAHTLNSKYHMSRHQIEGAFVEIGKVFGREWKAFTSNGVDNDTLPAMTNLVRTRSYVEAMALNNIVEEMMSSDSSSITYANDGSSMSKVGNYVVQSIHVNGIERALPALSIVTESHESLKELEITTLKILSASTGYKYSEDEIFKKVSFVMTDSTAHNIGVTSLVCDELGIEESERPKTLLCNLHPLMMFQNKEKEFYSEVQQSFGNKKLDECFTVDIDFKDENFILKAIKCLTNFVNRENSAKPWNRHSHFSKFIAPKKNEVIALKDHRFNRLNDCCLLALYHFDDIAEYLGKFEHITNNMAILDRSFIDMGDVLKPIFCATALIGHHITRPFQRLLVDVDTTYETLLEAFP